jgi:hypothetical protein
MQALLGPPHLSIVLPLLPREQKRLGNGIYR